MHFRSKCHVTDKLYNKQHSLLRYDSFGGDFTKQTEKNQLFIFFYCLKQLLIPAIITVHLATTRKYQYQNGYHYIDIVCKVDEGENLIKIHSSDKYHIQT